MYIIIYIHGIDVYAYLYVFFASIDHNWEIAVIWWFLLVISCRFVVELQMCIFKYTHHVYIYIHMQPRSLTVRPWKGTISKRKQIVQPSLHPTYRVSDRTCGAQNGQQRTAAAASSCAISRGVQSSQWFHSGEFPVQIPLKKNGLKKMVWKNQYLTRKK